MLPQTLFNRCRQPLLDQTAPHDILQAHFHRIERFNLIYRGLEVGDAGFFPEIDEIVLSRVTTENDLASFPGSCDDRVYFTPVKILDFIDDNDRIPDCYSPKIGCGKEFDFPGVFQEVVGILATEKFLVYDGLDGELIDFLLLLLIAWEITLVTRWNSRADDDNLIETILVYDGVEAKVKGEIGLTGPRKAVYKNILVGAEGFEYFILILGSGFYLSEKKWLGFLYWPGCLCGCLLLDRQVTS